MDDLGDLVHEPLDNDTSVGYSKVSLDSPARSPYTLDDVEPSPDNRFTEKTTVSPNGNKPQLRSDLTGMQSIALNNDPLSAPNEINIIDDSADVGGSSSSVENQDAPETIRIHDAPGGGSGDLGQQPRPITISVKVPERTEVSGALGMTRGHWDYVIRIDSTIPGMLANGMEVKRRFSEFDSLYKMLHTQFRGYIIPPLPPKSLIGIIENSSEDFLRLRRADLQAFLRAVVAHPMLQKVEPVKVFLLQPGDLSRNPAWINLAAVPSSPKKIATSESALARAISAPSGSAAFANLGNFMSWMKQSTLSVFQPPKRELPPDEGPLRKAKEMLEDLGRLLQLATQSARTVCHDIEKMSTNFKEFGFNMGMLCKYEETLLSQVGQYTEAGRSANNRATDLRNMAKCQAKQHTIWKNLSLKSAATLVKLHDYLILMPEAIKALEAREAKLDDVFALQEELAQKKHQLEGLQGAGGTMAASTGTSRAGLLSQNILILERQLEDARENYELIKGRNHSELSRIGLERESDFKRMMYSFAVNQAQLVQSSADLWASLAHQYA